MLLVILCQFLKHQVYCIFEIFIIFPCFGSIYHIYQSFKILRFFVTLIIDIANICRIKQTLGFHPKIFPGFIALAFGIYDQSVYQFQNILFAVQIVKRIIVHRLVEIDRVYNLYVVRLKNDFSVFVQYPALFIKVIAFVFVFKLYPIPVTLIRIYLIVINRAAFLQHIADLDKHRTFRICDHIGRVHLHYVGLYKEPCLTCTRATDYLNVLVSCIFWA